MDTRKLIARAVIFLSLIGLNTFMFRELVAVLRQPQDGMEPALAALIGGLIGAITTAIGLASKDFFNPQ